MQQGHKAVRNPPPLGVGRFKEISQEVIEAACRAFFNNDSNPDWEKLGERVRRMLAALEAVAPLMTPQWIPCSERMPEDNREVLVHCAFADEYGSWTGAGFHVPAGWKSQDSMIMDDIPIAFPVTHWLPLPVPPQPPKETK